MTPPDLRAALLAVVRSHEPGQPVHIELPREKWETLLDGMCAAPSPAVSLTPDLTATIRLWCEQGRIEGAYKANGREWRIPAARLEAFRETLRQGGAEGGKSVIARNRSRASCSTPDIGAWRREIAS